MKWIPASLPKALESKGTTAHRIATGEGEWIERYGSRALICTPQREAPARRLLPRLESWSREADILLEAVYYKPLVHNPGEENIPRLIHGPAGLPTNFTVHESGIAYEVNLANGYSTGLFMDQRMNRLHLASLGPRSVLNGFAYTCAFSVAGAKAGATETTSIDLARKALDWGKHLFELNGLPTDGHHFIADDVRKVLPRLARKGTRFDTIILDPPTFARSKKSGVFRVEKEMPGLFAMALEVAAPGASILLSTNCRSLGTAELKAIAQRGAAEKGLSILLRQVPAPPDIPGHAMPSTLWATLKK